jgi:hypothetical protein
MTTPEQARAALEKVQAIERLTDDASAWRLHAPITRAKITRLAREAAALLAPVGEPWQPIATAPSGSGWVLVHHPDWTLPEIAQRSGYTGVWQTMDHGIAPTHWMPLQPPPVAPVGEPKETP